MHAVIRNEHTGGCAVSFRVYKLIECINRGQFGGPCLQTILSGYGCVGRRRLELLAVGARPAQGILKIDHHRLYGRCVGGGRRALAGSAHADRGESE